MAIDILVCAIAGDCCDTGAIDLRNSIGKTVGYYAIGSVGVGKKNKRKNKEKGQLGREKMEMVMALFLACNETYHTWSNP